MKINPIIIDNQLIKILTYEQISITNVDFFINF